MKKTTIKEYDSEGRLVKEVITEEDGTTYWGAPYLEIPVYPNIPLPYPRWNDGTIHITCDCSQKG